MATLTVFSDDRPDAPLHLVADPDQVVAELASSGVRHERWPLQPGIVPGTAPDAVLAAYRGRIADLQARHGYAAVDVVSIAPDDPDRAAKRARFLPEHTHREDEVRFFAAGCGLFSLHLGGRVLQVRCVAGDVLAVPDGTRHWFDMGPAPAFAAVRWFTDPAGWVAAPTGWAGAQRFPTLDA